MIILDEINIRKIIAEKYGVPYTNIKLNIQEEWVGYGENEHREHVVKAYVDDVIIIKRIL